MGKTGEGSLLALSLAAAGLLPLGQHDLAVLEDGDLHERRQLAVLPAELLHLVVLRQQGGAVAEVERVVAGPDVHRVLPLRPACRHHQLPVAVHLGVLVELRVHRALLPATPPPTARLRDQPPRTTDQIPGTSTREEEEEEGTWPGRRSLGAGGLGEESDGRKWLVRDTAMRSYSDLLPRRRRTMAVDLVFELEEKLYPLILCLLSSPPRRRDGWLEWVGPIRWAVWRLIFWVNKLRRKHNNTVKDD